VELAVLFFSAMTTFIRFFFILMALLGAYFVWHNIELCPRTDDAEILANMVGVAAQVGGTITEIHVVDNQKVKRGDLILQLDARPYEAEAARARTKLNLVRLEVTALEEQIKAAKATLRDRQAKAAYAIAHYERLKPLLEGNFASADKVQQTESEAESSAALVKEAEAAVVRAENLYGEYSGKNTRIEEAEAELRNAELRVSYCKIFASCDGYITNLKIAPGSYAATGEQLFTIVDSSIWYVMGNFREIDIHRVKRGQSAKVFLMGRRLIPIDGIVQGIARGVIPYVQGIARSCYPFSVAATFSRPYSGTHHCTHLGNHCLDDSPDCVSSSSLVFVASCRINAGLGVLPFFYTLWPGKRLLF
jgi:multidrug efflux system membrane fusion protein